MPDVSRRQKINRGTTDGDSIVPPDQGTPYTMALNRHTDTGVPLITNGDDHLLVADESVAALLKQQNALLSKILNVLSRTR